MTDRVKDTIDWRRVIAEAVNIALTFTQRDAEELVEEAIVLFLEGKTTWDRSCGETLPEHLVAVGLDARKKKQRTERRRWHPKVVSKIVQAFVRPPPTPEDQLEDAEEQERKSRRVERLLADLADDPDACAIVRLVQQGVSGALEQQGQSGMSIERVRNARKRIKRRMAALSQEDEEKLVGS
jgi:hypothetical protein